jgi:phage FluMu gp28-like protein
MVTGIRGKIDREYENVQREIEKGLARTRASVCDDPVEFCQKQLHFTPTSYQEKLLRDTNQFVVACWSRQSGKSYTVAALILHYALRYPGSRIAILAPGLRQSRKLLKRVMMFLPRLPGVVDGRLLKTKLELFNGSSIEALPKNPETIRGETLNMVVVDELCFVNDDEELYDAIIFSLGSTNGRFIGLSTPGPRDSLFYQMWTDDQRFPGISRHHVSCREALEPNGPLKKEILEKVNQHHVHVRVVQQDDLRRPRHVHLR